MNVKKELYRLCSRSVIVLDGATGTELQKRGMAQGACPELWALRHPQVIQSIHADYQKAGAQIIYTATFGANRLKLGHYNVRQVRHINKKLALLAKAGAGKKAFVCGDISSTGHFVKPFGTLDFEEAVNIYKEQVQGLLDGGVDMFAIETMMDIQEARAALIAVKELTDKFVMVTLTFEESGRTLNGTDAVSALITLQSLGADAVGCNCSTGPAAMVALIKAMKPYAKVPLVAKPNAGMPKLVGERTMFDMGPKAFASFTSQFVEAGVNIMGGCCGTTPEHIFALAEAARAKMPRAPVRRSIAAFSSARKAVIIEKKSPFIIIGERINPTGKKDLQQELLQGRFSILRQLAGSQEQEGAHALDLNVGVAGIDEEKIMKEAVCLLSTITDLPLSIDSASEKTIEAALRIYPGRALINSISGDTRKLNKLLSIAAKYGAMFVLLPLTGKGIAETAREREKIVRTVFRRAQKCGFTKDDFIVDSLAMSIASHPDAAIEALKIISWCSQEFNCRTIVGLSNISFGMPARRQINGAFLAMARARGLTMAIAQGSAIFDARSCKAAKDIILNKRRNDALMQLTALATKNNTLAQKPMKRSLSREAKIFQAIVEGNKEVIAAYIKDFLRQGASAQTIVNEIVIPAIKKAGDLFERKEYFLPQLVAAAESAKKAFVSLEPLLKKEKKPVARKAVVILSTVKGDIHDIGKNIVSLMLQNHGFVVIDLGKDVSAEKIINAAVKHKANIVGLSALMTTTMIYMKDVAALAKKRKVRCSFLLGGAAVTEQFAKSIGAAYGRDSVEAVRLAEELSA